ncbi:hypothetical protein IMSAGC014_00482 [Bacteroidaceae bacterium]|nr:hypothetical protein IMSAGC014_00482 [Bacteroidaceae bacterium]
MYVNIKLASQIKRKEINTKEKNSQSILPFHKRP